MRNHPHPTTRDIPALPLPELDATLEKFLRASEAVTEPAALEELTGAVQEFRDSPVSTALQEKLTELAEDAAAAGSNWMADAWIGSYLANREPLLTSTNVLFQLNLPAPATDTATTDRVLDLIQRIGAVHLSQAAGTIEEEIDARDSRLSMDGWMVFNGGIRTPLPDEDASIISEAGAENRNIGLIFRGRLFEVPLTGPTGRLVTDEQLRASIDRVLASAEPGAEPEITENFVAFSAAGSAALAADDSWRTAGTNAETYQRLAELLFTLTIDDQPGTLTEVLRNWTFLPGYTWAYKPLSYLLNIAQDIVAVNVEHSGMDGGTLTTAVTRMQQVDPAELVTEASDREAVELRWENPPAYPTAALEQAEKLHLQLVTARRDTEGLPFKISADATAQLTMMIAQQLTFGRVRAHYQASDMRQYRAGRTEAIRPVTVEAVNFVQALVNGEATLEQFRDALNAQRGWVKAAKTGQGFDRHLMMLAELAAEQSEDLKLFGLPHLARTDFLSTSTMGTAAVVIRYPYAPTTEGGFGVQYTLVEAGTEFAVTWAEGTEGAEEFVVNLPTAGELLFDFIAGLPKPEAE